MTVSTPHRFALLIPKTLAALPIIHQLPWPGPFKYLPTLVQLKVAEKICNRLLREQIDSGDLNFLEGVSLRLKIKDMGFDWAITKMANRLIFSKGYDGAETTFAGNSSDLVLLASRREDPDTLFFQRRLSIEGNTELGLEVKNLIDSIDMDEMPILINHALYLSADFVEALPH
jgi:predicted lipid carrier protein YhbT